MTVSAHFTDACVKFTDTWRVEGADCVMDHYAICDGIITIVH